MSVSTRGMGPAMVRWARGVLAADATILAGLPDGANGVYGGDPLQDANRPYMVVQVQATPRPLRVAVGGHRFWTTVRLLVKAVGRPQDYGDLVTLANRADELLDMAQFADVGDDVVMVACVRDGEFAPPANDLVGELTEQVGFFYDVKGREKGQT